MSTSSTHPKRHSRRIESLQNNGGGVSREGSRVTRKRLITHHEAYLYALRVAFLAYLLQPTAKRTQHVAAPKQPSVQRASSSVQDLMKDFSLIRDHKSTRFPKDFMSKLIDRLQNVLMNREPRQEYKDAAIKRSFGGALNAFMDPGFRKRVDKDRRVEDLVLIFYSKATAELQKGKAPTDDSWKLMVDRHVALFVRLVSLIMKENDWAKDRPELASRLSTLESKLLIHDQDLAGDGSNGSTIEVLVPLSYKVEDMPLVQVVARIFGHQLTQVQSDIDTNKNSWTEKEALQDLKTYQTLLSLESKKTLTSDDFDLEDAYEQWKKAETPDLSQMMLAIVQSNPELAKTTHVQPRSHAPSVSDANKPNYGQGFGPQDNSTYAIDQPVDMSAMNSERDRASSIKDDEHPFTFIPPDTRGFYRMILAQALTHDLNDSSLQPSEADGDAQPLKILSKQSTELLNEVSLRWRLPFVSRAVLFLDVMREKFIEDEIPIPTLDHAFLYFKSGIPDGKKDAGNNVSQVLDRTRWTLTDFSLMQQVLSALFDNLLRGLYQTAIQCYESKPPSVGPFMAVLAEHIIEDPSCPKSGDDLDKFSTQLYQGLKEKAFTIYKENLEKHLPEHHDQWEFYHVIELGKATTLLAQKIQKRFKKNPDILGANPLTALVEVVLPLYAEDSRHIVGRILEISREKEEEVPIEDGFTLYGELVEIRRIHNLQLPQVEFAFKIEDQLADFVWRWIRLTENNLVTWVENAVRQDNFAVRSDGDEIPTEDERHSVSVIDIFSSFNQTIDKIVSLNWDNDLHYAKFMTGLAKIVGQGVARYCELVEARFSKEMDRPTYDQEVQASQTRQERWLQMAKDTWTQKDKIEPFQFFPESFVKLNNIEFASRQLDKIEREVNVDACAEVIEKNTPVIDVRKRKISNYVFTIKIVEAEDLKACDMNGLSDPYVVLGDEYQKRLAKTRIIHANLNPRWDETVDITTHGPINIIATIWDWDAMGEHDCVGRTSIKLDPSHFSDFMPREYWLDLDTQGRLLLRVSMEGERDDIQFYFGKAFRTLKRTERDMTRTITDKLSAYINHCLSKRALKSLLNKGITLQSVSSYFKRNTPQPTVAPPTDEEVAEALKPLFTYFDDNFAIMNQTLTSQAMVMVMTRLWKEVLATIESLVVPPLSDKPSQQRPLNQQELDIVFKWLQLLFDFFHAVDEDTGEANGVPLEVLRSPKYFDIKTLNFFYSEPTDALIRESERMATANAARSTANRNRLSAPATLGLGMGTGSGPSSLLASTAAGKRPKSIMLSRNLGTMRKAKEDKRKEAQAEPNDDMILRILRMRPEAERYLRDRSRQKERLAAAAAAELIVKQSLMAGGGRMTGSLPRR